MLTPGNRSRFKQLYNVGLNLGMRDVDAAYYAEQILIEEMEHGEWWVTPKSAEALANNRP